MFHLQSFINQISPMPSSKEDFLQTVHTTIFQNLQNEDFNAAILAEEMCLSRSQLHRNLKAYTNFAASRYIRRFRLKIAAKLIAQKSNSIGQIAFKVGFNNLSYFSKCFKEELGKTPMEYAKLFEK